MRSRRSSASSHTREASASIPGRALRERQRFVRLPVEASGFGVVRRRCDQHTLTGVDGAAQIAGEGVDHRARVVLGGGPRDAGRVGVPGRLGVAELY